MIPFSQALVCESEVSRSVVSFSEKICEISSIEEWLLFLSSNIPKKLKTGEIILFYESKQFGLRRAYVRKGIFYEEVAKNPWPQEKEMKYAEKEEVMYLAQEMGRPFSHVLRIPFTSSHSSIPNEKQPLLFIEHMHSSKREEEIKKYLAERLEILNLILDRALLNTSVSSISHLWSYVFGKCGEPLAFLHNSTIIKSNAPFDKLLSDYPSLLNIQDISEPLSLHNCTYQIHYYPINHLKKLKDVKLLYCQDMTKYYNLKEQFFQSEKMSAFYKLGRNIAHELNNPLTGIRSMSQILSKDENLKDFSEDFKAVEEAAARSQKIIENLLTFSYPKKQKILHCSLNQVIRDTLPLLQSMTSGIHLDLDIFSKDVEVIGSFPALQQVIYNLIINACQALKDFDQQANPKIKIQIGIANNNQACLKIEDNGPGIPSEYLDKIFQPLWTTKKQGEGTGLGLGISRQIIHQFGGNIQISSHPNQFTIFSIHLPLKGAGNE